MDYLGPDAMIDSASSPERTAALIAALLAVDPSGLGGIRIKAGPTPAREAWLNLFRHAMGSHAPWRKVPVNIPENRLLGGLDLTATLSAGRPIAERGLLAECNGGSLILTMAERAEIVTIAHIIACLDQGKLRLERDGLGFVAPARFCAIALDEAIGDEPGTGANLLDRLAFDLDLNLINHSDALEELFTHEAILAARDRLMDVSVSPEMIDALCAAAMTLGISSVRASLFAIKVARVSAALAGRHQTNEADATLAAELVLAPRARSLPPPEASGSEEDQRNEQSNDQPDGDADQDSDSDPNADSKPDTGLSDLDLTDLILEAAQAALPPGLLEKLQQAKLTTPRKGGQGRAGAVRKTKNRGRAIGTKAGSLGAGARLNVIETMRAAAPWQTVRRQARKNPSPSTRLEIRAQDFRINRFKQRSETATIFVVDGSGSQALNRMAEAKGAVELLLNDCYARRDHVALIAFRGQGAEILLPPTRSLVRTKRALAGLPGGGGTPLASGIDITVELARAILVKGQIPVAIFLTDGRANIARDGTANRIAAQSDAVEAAGALRTAGIRCLLIDTSPRPQDDGVRIAESMGANYLPLPFADAAALSNIARKALDDTSGMAA
jgi:magnesium chelatase subunit D